MSFFYVCDFRSELNNINNILIKLEIQNTILLLLDKNTKECLTGKSNRVFWTNSDLEQSYDNIIYILNALSKTFTRQQKHFILAYVSDKTYELLHFF